MFLPGIVLDILHDGGQGQQIRGNQIIVPVDGILLFCVVHGVYPGEFLLAEGSAQKHDQGYDAAADQAKQYRGRDDFELMFVL